MKVERLFDFIYYQLENFPQARALSWREGNEWLSLSTKEVVEKTNAASCGLLKLGLEPGDKIGLVAEKNRPEWIILDLAMQQIGVINVPVYPTISSAEYTYIFSEAEVKYCFTGGESLFPKIHKATSEVPGFQGVYTFDKGSGGVFWEDIFEGDNARLRAKVEEIKAGIKPEDLATIIYTSGTTGYPKGVMLSHDNIVSNIKAVEPLIPLKAGDRALSFLPLCHIFEKAVTYAYFYTGINIYHTGTDNLGGEEGDLNRVQPHFFTTVPRLLEKVYEKIYAKGLSLKGLKKSLFFWALELNRHFEYEKEYNFSERIKRKIADALIYRKWRKALGGNIKGILTGAAPCPEYLIRIFSGAGIPIREGYGLTESSPGIAIGRFEPGGAQIGTVGPLIDGVEVIIDREGGDYKNGEGEIVVTGPNVMLGYYKKNQETNEVIFEKEGKRWLRTGDVGKFVEEPGGRRYLKITDRKKELFKTSGGKYVAPAPIESKLKEDFMIEHVMLVGDARKFVSAIIVPSAVHLEQWCRNEGAEWKSFNETVNLPAVIFKFQEIIEKHNVDFSHVEQIKKFILVADAWEPEKENGSEAELTPTLKLKRRVILRKYEREIEELYFT